MCQAGPLVTSFELEVRGASFRSFGQLRLEKGECIKQTSHQFARPHRLKEPGLIKQRLDQQRPSSREYLLTDQGIDNCPIFVLLKESGENWVDVDAGPDVRLIHTAGAMAYMKS